MFPVETEWRLLTADAQEEGSGGIGPVVIDADNDERFSFEDAGNSKLIIDILAPELNQSEIFCHETHTLERELVASFALMTTRQYPMNAICVCVQGFCLVCCSPEINGYCNISQWPQTSVAFLLYNTLLERYTCAVCRCTPVVSSRYVLFTQTYMYVGTLYVCMYICSIASAGAYNNDSAVVVKHNTVVPLQMM